MVKRIPRALMFAGVFLLLSGTTITVASFNDSVVALSIGLTLGILGALALVGACIVVVVQARSGSYEDVYNSGYELGESHGYTRGRDSIRPRVVHLYTTCHSCGEVTPVNHSRGQTA